MAGPPPNRSYSFDNDDEGALNPNHRDQFQSYQAPQQSISPPPSYTYDNRQTSPPPPPVHRSRMDPAGDSSRDNSSAYLGHASYRDSPDPFSDERHGDYRTPSRRTSTLTPGSDAAIGGGISGVALGVASSHERESGMQATRNIDNGSGPHPRGHADGNYDSTGSDTPYMSQPPRPRPFQQSSSYGAALPLGAAAPAAAGWATPQSYHPSEQGTPLEDYPLARGTNLDSPYKRYSSPWDPRVDQNDFHPDDIADDGDDVVHDNPRRRSVLGMGRQSDKDIPKGIVVGGAAAGGALGGMVGSRQPSGNYGPVPASDGNGAIGQEKMQWLAEEAAARKRKKIIFICLGILAFCGIVAGATVAGILGSRKASETSSASATSGLSASEDDGNGDLDKDSDEIKALMNNKDLHRVFPGMAYTPFNAQYPACLTNPPSQNNVTRDMAVLSQLTKVIRLYGTDCNQTEMVLHSIDKLGLTDIKVWMAVWLDGNSTTNNRGFSDMYSILDRHGPDPFAGVVIGNEVLFREEMTMTEIISTVTEVRTNLTEKSIDLPIAVADLGDNWEAELAKVVDVVMSNIHPFFAGIDAEKATDWTINFWQMKDVVLTQGTQKENIISEVGWPSGGGKDCGEAPKCTDSTPGAVAGIDEMNTFMDDFVCEALNNGTNFFW